MPHCIARIFEPLLRLLLPAPGRHRGAETDPATPLTDAPTARLPRVSAPVLRGEDIGLVRPYLVAHERRQEERRQRARRRALVLAAYGIDAGPRWIHGVEVPA